ncbi:outer dense fiber protein 2-like [Ptychodera flava]|uniref:outer dense fiber protein 2-like n=1 Tax=Ptychodera flava TaxID=63121 RepID=UPI003969E68E
MSAISSMARFREGGKSPSGTEQLRRSGSFGKKSNLAMNFNPGSVKAPVNRSLNDLHNVEAEYIKNLQQQIYFLELEANFLREQARKATEMQPRMAEEAEKMLRKLREMQNDIDGLGIDLRRKESNLDLVTKEKERAAARLRTVEDTFARDKKVLVEEIVLLKKQLDTNRRDLLSKEQQIMEARSELDKGSVSLTSADHQIQILRTQLDQKDEQLRSTQHSLEEKRAETLRTQTQYRELEDKYYSSTAAIQDKAMQDLRDEIKLLRQKLKDTELNADQDRYLRNKMSDDCSGLVKENALLGAQVLDLQKQLDRERTLREDRDTKRAADITELVTVKDREQQLQFELNQAKNQLQQEKDRIRFYMEKLSAQEEVTTSQSLSSNTMRSKLTELESLHSTTEAENVQLRRDKRLLVDHVAELQQKLKEKEDDNLVLRSRMSELLGKVEDAERKNLMESSIQSQKWGEFEKMAESMKNLSRTMTARSYSPDYA